MRRALAGLLGVAVAGFFAVGVRAAAVPPAIVLSPTCGSIGTTVKVTGSGWTPGFDVTITFDPQGKPLSSVTVPGKSIGTDGTFTTSLTVPDRPNRVTPYQVQATQPLPAGVAAISKTAQAPFNVPCLALTANPTCGTPGDVISVEGIGFGPDDQVAISFTPPVPAQPDAVAIPKPDTTFVVDVRVPARSPGTYVLLAVQIRTKLEARVEFQIPCLKAAIVLRPAVGPAGTVTTVTGTGFPVGAVVKLSWSQGIPLRVPSITIGSSQGFQMTLLIFPHDQLGLRHLNAGPDLSAANAPLFNIATADFLVVPGTEQPRDFSWRH